MYQIQVNEINKKLNNNKKAIIAIGCSFVQGQGAVDDELYNTYEWKYDEGEPLTIQVTPKERKRLIKRHRGLVGGDTFGGKIDFTMMEYKNSFVNVLCEKYFAGNYTPINLGIRGCGNRASIKELYMYPDLDLHKAEEIIVIYCPSGLERFDFINDQATDHFNWKCMWPAGDRDGMPEGGRKQLWTGYADELSSPKFEIMEQLAHVQELITWCKANNAKLIVTPGFDRRYDKDYFTECLSQNVSRNENGMTVSKRLGGLIKSKSDKTHLIDLFPWDLMFKPEGHTTFIDLVISKELTLENKQDHYCQFLGHGSPDGWITPCSHPSQKAHDLFANQLYTHITKD